MAVALAVTTHVPTAFARTKPLRKVQEPAGLPATLIVMTLPPACPGEETLKIASYPTSTAAMLLGLKIGSLGRRVAPATCRALLSADLTEGPTALTATT